MLFYTVTRSFDAFYRVAVDQRLIRQCAFLNDAQSVEITGVQMGGIVRSSALVQVTQWRANLPRRVIGAVKVHMPGGLGNCGARIMLNPPIATLVDWKEAEVLIAKPFGSR
jgi:hypothetical protein